MFLCLFFLLVFCYFFVGFCGVHVAHLVSTFHVFFCFSSFCVLCPMILVSLDCPFLITALRFSLTIIYPLLVPTESKNAFVSEFVLPHTHHTHAHIYILWKITISTPQKNHPEVNSYLILTTLLSTKAYL